jgi:N6-adenosine-specific RNA methylase IME4
VNGALPIKVLYADPPWQFGDALPGERGASHKYRTMPVDAIARFPLPQLASSAVLFMWGVAAMTEEALFVAKAWGFRQHSEIVWVKTRNDGTGIRIGMGRIVRAAHETCRIMVRGRTPPPLVRNVPSVLMTPKREHSQKPDEMYGLIESLYPGPYCELFARRVRAGWTQFGRELADEQAAP